MGYTKYDYRILRPGKAPYFPRADDPMKIVVKAMDDAVTLSRIWRNDTVRKQYTNFSHSRPVIAWDKHNRGATITTAQLMEGTPQTDNESDLKNLAKLHVEQCKTATLENTTNRIQMMLGMLGDVTVTDSEQSTRSAYSLISGKHYKVFEVKGQKLILIEGDGSE